MSYAEDVPLTAPHLTNLSAEVLAQSLELVFNANTELGAQASTALFQQLREHWAKNEESSVSMLKAFCNSARFPLESLDLSGLTLTERILVDLLTAHASTLSSVDLSYIKGVNGHKVNKLLEEANVIFPNLKTLKVTDLDILSFLLQPPTKVKQISDHSPSAQLSEAQLEEKFSKLQCESESSEFGDMLPHSSSASNIDHNEWVDVMKEEGWTDLAETERKRAPLAERCPNLKELYLAKPHVLPHAHISFDLARDHEKPKDVVSRIGTSLKHLEILDLSRWLNIEEDIKFLHSLYLSTLILHDVPDLYRADDSIIVLQNLKVLDLSQSSRETGTYPRPVSSLHKLVTNLKQLTHLDISSTNLASQPTPYDWPEKETPAGPVPSDIYGLRFLERPLEFLGLLFCDSTLPADKIPALQVAGNANEDQILTAMKVYIDRPILLACVLSDSYQLYRFGKKDKASRHTEALHLVLNAMRVHLEDSTLQIAGSASLFYLMRKVNMNMNTKKEVITALLNGMEMHMKEPTMVSNCCLSLCQFEIPQEILFDYSRLATLLVTVLQQHKENLTQRIVVFLLNSMACHVEGDQKVQIGKLGAIEKILEKIKRKLFWDTCDDVMEVGWSFLWNITDETPANSALFVHAGGLSLFQKCYEKFPMEFELIRNLSGLVGNLAEVDSLRSELMNDDYIKILGELLDIEAESIEISYNSAGILAQIVSDGSLAWDGLKVNREEVMHKIAKTTEKWDLKTRRFINYRSFRPILRLLPLWDAWASQHWAVWALASFTTTDGFKYCPYVVEEGGVALLADLMNDDRSTAETKMLAQIVLDNIAKFAKRCASESAPTDA